MGEGDARSERGQDGGSAIGAGKSCRKKVPPSDRFLPVWAAPWVSLPRLLGGC
jgi:hypothetical protein